MSLQLNDELLSAFLDGEVSAEERLQIESVLSQSPDWQRRYRQLVDTVNVVRRLPEERLAKDFSQNILGQIALRQQAEGTASGVTPQIAVSTPSDRKVSRRIRENSRSNVPAWIAVAACLLIAVCLGIGYQAGIFQSTSPTIVAKGDQTPVVGEVPDADRVADTKPNVELTDMVPKPDAGIRSPFPTVEELANEQGNPSMDELPKGDEGPEAMRSPFGIRINVRTKPGEKEKPAPTMVRPNSLARTVFNLDTLDDPELDRRQLGKIDHAGVVQEIMAWVDMDGDKQLSDMEMQQAWFRFAQTEVDVPALSEEALIAIDQGMNQKISTAEFYLAIASVRWNRSESIRQMWFRLDANGDEVWSQEDFAVNARFAPKGNPGLAQQLSKWHSLLDRSRDGNVTRLELTLASDQVRMLMKNWEQKILNPQAYDQTMSLMMQFDRDGNGQLSGRELMRLAEKNAAIAPRLENAGPDGVSAYELYLVIEVGQL